MRNLNYEMYVEQGERRISHSEDYNSHNTEQLDVSEMCELLLQLDCIRKLVTRPLATVE
ncbi:UDP-glucose 4-epimerase [compost metagenome]